MLAGNDNIHESFNEFEIQSNLMRDRRVSCSRTSKISMSPFFSFHSCGYTWEIVRLAFTGPLVLWFLRSDKTFELIFSSPEPKAQR